MKTEIINLLEKESELSGEINDENINGFSQLVRDIGKRKTEYLDRCEISKGLNTKFIAKNLYLYNEVGSTNTLAKYLAKNGIENGSVVISEKQNNGRGRTGKSWESPLGGVWMSIILSPEVDISKIPLITITTGVAAAIALERIGVKNPEIKWPNDIMINGKKVCGILTEAVSNFNTIGNIIVGVGIDANLSIETFPAELQDITTTLEIELGKKVNENILIKLFLEEFERIYELLKNDCVEDILREWRKRSYSVGKLVEVRKPHQKSYDAYVIGITKNGELVVEKNDGTFEKVISRECIIKR